MAIPKGQAISHELGIQQAWETSAPEGVRQFFGDNKEAVPSFLLAFGHHLADWFHDYPICDSLCKGSHQWGLLLLVIGIGLFLAYQYSQMASNISAI